MKITITFVLIALLATSFGFKIRQGVADVAADLGAVATTTVDNALEDTETVINQGIEDTEAYANCMAACTNPMQFMQCSGSCFADATQAVASDLAEDTQTLQAQVQGGAGAAPGPAPAAAPAPAPVEEVVEEAEAPAEEAAAEE